MKDRMDKLDRLKELEANSVLLENYLKGIDSQYFQNGSASLSVVTTDYNFKKTDCSEFNEFTFDKQLMINFLKAQLEKFKKESKSLLESLVEETK